MTDEKKEKKSGNFKKKLLKTLFILLLVAIIGAVIINKCILDKKRMINMVNTVLPNSVSTRDALSIKQYAIDTYAELLKQGKTETAYSMLTDEYKAYKTYDEYLKTLEGINFDTIKLQQVKQMSSNGYIAYVEYMRNDVLEETTYFVIVGELNNRVMDISPDKFLYSFVKEEKFKKDGVKYTVKECFVEAESIKLSLNIKNNSTKDAKIKSIGVGLNDYQEKMKIYEDPLIVPAREAIDVEIELESNYYVPQMLKVQRILDEETLRSYTFYFEKNI